MVSRNPCPDLQPCDHEEADTRIALHMYNAVKDGARNILVRTVDTDVLVILVGLFSNFGPETNIWIAFGVGKSFRYYKTLGPDISKALPFFHAFTGSDTTSQFHGKGKKSTWDAWRCYPETTIAFVGIAERPFQPLTLKSQFFKIIERYTCILYEKCSTISHVNELREDMFS